MSHGRLVLALVAVASGLALPAAAQAELRWRSCVEGNRCARLSVPLDRSGSVSGTLSLRVLRDRGRTTPNGGVTLLLAGDPGESAIHAYASEASIFGDLLEDVAEADRRNRVVVLDTRGTGGSGALRCRDLEAAGATDAGVEAAACAALLGERRGLYGTAETVEDIESLRAELGVERLTIVGVTYGAYVAQRYALSHPDRVERLVLDSPVDAAGQDPLRLDSFAAAARALPLLCRRGCEGFSDDVAGDSARLADRLAARPLRGQVVGADGDPRPATLTAQELLFTALHGDHDPVSRAQYPAAVVSALRGDTASLFRLKRRAIRAARGPAPRRFSAATRAAVLCEEVRFPWAWQAGAAERDAAAAGAGALLSPEAATPFGTGAAIRSDLMRLCRRWPTASPAPPADPGPMPDVPVLVLASTTNLAAPLETARRVAQRFAQAQLVPSATFAGHVLAFDGSECVSDALERFLVGRPAAARCRQAALLEASPPVPASLDGVQPVAGVRGVRGRVLRGVGLTFGDLINDTLSAAFTDPSAASAFDRGAGTGLRGGRYSFRGGGEGRVKRYELVPGVRLSLGPESFGDDADDVVLIVDGPGRVDGRLKIGDELDDEFRLAVRGRLGGRAVRAKVGIGTLIPFFLGGR